MEISQLLEKLESCLRDYQLIREANAVAGVMKLLETDQEKAFETIMQETWWIGEDAVAEADLAIAGGFTAKARQDQDAFQELIIELYQRLSELGYDSDYARLVTTQYHKWLVSRM